MSKTIRLDDQTVVRTSKIEAIYKYNWCTVEVYVNGNCFKIKFSTDKPQEEVEKITDHFVDTLELLVEPKKDSDAYDVLKHNWSKSNGTFKEFILDDYNTRKII